MCVSIHDSIENSKKMERNLSSEKFPIGSKLPQFELLATDGQRYGTSYLQGGTLALVIFSCNHCPYVKGSDEAIVAVVRRFEKDGLRTLAISSNDAIQYPEDSFDNMKLKSTELKLPFPYLYDETQAVARAFDAACTPECFLFDKASPLIFHGTVNDNPKDRMLAKREYLAEAITQALKGQKPEPSFVHPIGCSIKWR